MKTLFFLIASILIIPFSQAQNDNVYAVIDGMGCAFCANGMERAFRDIKEKRNFSIDLEKGTMVFDIPTQSRISEEDILTRVDKAGYTARYIKITRSSGQEIVWNVADKSKKAEEKAYTERIIGVSGNCGMCKTRIEAAVNELEGIFFSFWNQETQKLHVRFDEAKVTQADIEKHVAHVGHDTENFRAEDHVYENLHGCCKYERQQ